MTTPSSISRRKVTAGMAWAVPAVATVAAVPAYAASPVCVTATSGNVVKYPGNSSGHGLKQAYGFPVTLTNTTENTVRVSPGTAVVDFDKKDQTGTVELYDVDPCKGGVKLDASSALLTLAPHESRTIYLVVNNTGNSANEAGCVLATLKVALVGAGPAIGELCDIAEVSAACFSATPPTASC